MEELLRIDGLTVAIVKMAGRFYVAYKGSNVGIDGGSSCFVYGTGYTIEEACADYKRIISGKRIIFNDDKPNRKDMVIVFVEKDAKGKSDAGA